MGKQELIDSVKAKVYQNNQSKITGQILQNALVEIIDDVFREDLIVDRTPSLDTVTIASKGTESLSLAGKKGVNIITEGADNPNNPEGDISLRTEGHGNLNMITTHGDINLDSGGGTIRLGALGQTVKLGEGVEFTNINQTNNTIDLSVAGINIENVLSIYDANTPQPKIEFSPYFLNALKNVLGI